MSKKKHALLSPSAAGRWLTCTAAPLLEETYPEEASSYAAEGTLAHEFAEVFARRILEPGSKSSATRKIKRYRTSALYDPEMEEHAAEYAKYVSENLADLKGPCEDAFAELEVKLDLTEYIPDGFGTADCVLIADDVMHVIDYKYGKGVQVYAAENPQMKIYALGALVKYSALYDIREVKMTIFQPRLGWVDTWEILAEDLAKWGENTVKPKAEEATEGPGTFCPSEEACRFCRARGECRARAEHFINAFDENPPELLTTLTNDEIGALLEKVKGMETWIGDLKTAAYGRIASGQEVPGWKLVEGRSSRKISDPDKAAKALKKAGLTEDQIFTRKLITITQIEKLLGKKDAAEVLAGSVEKPPGAPTLAPQTDKRPSMELSEAIIQAFDE